MCLVCSQSPAAADGEDSEVIVSRDERRERKSPQQSGKKLPEAKRKQSASHACCTLENKRNPSKEAFFLRFLAKPSSSGLRHICFGVETWLAITAKDGRPLHRSSRGKCGSVPLSHASLVMSSGGAFGFL